jgi:hypothetical protein
VRRDRPERTVIRFDSAKRILRKMAFAKSYFSTERAAMASARSL